MYGGCHTSEDAKVGYSCVPRFFSPFPAVSCDGEWPGDPDDDKGEGMEARLLHRPAFFLTAPLLPLPRALDRLFLLDDARQLLRPNSLSSVHCSSSSSSSMFAIPAAAAACLFFRSATFLRDSSRSLLARGVVITVAYWRCPLSEAEQIQHKRR